MRTVNINSGIMDLEVIVVDNYNKENGFVFPLRFKPWLNYQNYNKETNEFGYTDTTPDGEAAWIDTPIFTIKKDNELFDISDMTNYYNFQIQVLPQIAEGYYFYYSEKNLYTNIDLIDNGGMYTVEYKTKCESVSLDIELEKFNGKVPRVDSFEMEMIGINVK